MNRVVGFDDTSLKAYYKFNESSGNIINQSESAADLGSAADITITGATYSATGIIGNALSFDGTNDYGECGTSLSQWNFLHDTNASWTICFWMKALSAMGSQENGIIDTNGASASFTGLSIYGTTTQQLAVFIANGSTAVLQFGTGNNYIPDTTNFHFYTITYDHSLGSNNMTIKRDDANVQNATKTGNTPSSGNASHSMEIMRNTRTNSNYVNAVIDEVSIWDRILTDTELTSLYNSGSGLELY